MREEVLSRHLGPPPPAHLFHNANRRPTVPITRATAAVPSRARPQTSANGGSSRVPMQSSASVPTGLRRSAAQARRSPPESPDARRRVLQNARSPRTSSNSASASVATSAQLPSTAGWASSQAGRAASRSPTLPGAPVDDERPKPAASGPQQGRPVLSSTKPSAGLDKERSRPPGFERLSPKPVVANIPARPPGFEEPMARPGQGRSNVHIHHSDSEASALKTSSQIAPPPGFGRPVAGNPVLNPAVNSVNPSIAMAWSQEASADQVVTSQDRARARSAGQSAVGAPPRTAEQTRNIENVLAKLKLETGVGCEIHHIPTNANQRA